MFIFESNPGGVSLQHDAIDNCSCLMWVPEGIGTEAGDTCTYPRFKWHREGNTLIQYAAVEDVFDFDNTGIEEVEPGILKCGDIRYRKENPTPYRSEFHFSENRIDFSLSIENPHDTIIPKVMGWACFSFQKASWWNEANCHLLTTKGVQSIAQLRRESHPLNTYQAWLLRDETYDNPFFSVAWGYNAARAVAPVWVSRCDEADCSVVVGCDEAYLIASNANPCTDLGMKFGDLRPGEKKTQHGWVEFTSQSVDEIFKKLTDK